MATRTRVRLYKGIVEADAQERFRTDAVWAVREGWYPTEWHWDGMALRVTYTLGGQRSSADHPARTTIRRRRIRLHMRSLTRSRAT